MDGEPFVCSTNGGAAGPRNGVGVVQMVARAPGRVSGGVASVLTVPRIGSCPQRLCHVLRLRASGDESYCRTWFTRVMVIRVGRGAWDPS